MNIEIKYLARVRAPTLPRGALWQKNRATWLIAGAAALAALPGTALADVVPQGGGNIFGVPLYRGLAFGGINFNPSLLNGVDYVSNVAPLPVVTGNGTVAANGATFTGVGWSAFSGFYAGRNYAQLSVTNANASDQYYQVAGQGSATSVQFFTPEAAVAYATFNWHVSGTESVHPSGVNGRNTGRLDFGASTEPAVDVNWTHLFEENGTDPAAGLLNSMTKFGPGDYSYNLPISNIGDVINLFYWSSAFVQIDAGDAPGGSSFTLNADYSSTFVLQGVRLFDVNDDPINEWTLRDLNLQEDVFNQDGRLAPVLPPPDLAAVPEPATLALLAIAFAGLGFSRRRQ